VILSSGYRLYIHRSEGKGNRKVSVAISFARKGETMDEEPILKLIPVRIRFCEESHKIPH
jgi:hypothetical protein